MRRAAIPPQVRFGAGVGVKSSLSRTGNVTPHSPDELALHHHKRFRHRCRQPAILAIHVVWARAFKWTPVRATGPLAASTHFSGHL